MTDLTIPATAALIPAAVAEFYETEEYDTLAGAVRVLGDVIMSPLGIPALVAAQTEAHRLAKLALRDWLALPGTDDVTEWREGIDGLGCGVCESGVGWDTDYRDPDACFTEFVQNADDVVCVHCVQVIRS